MKILNELPKYSEDIHSELINNGWIQIKEPKTIATAIVLSIPIMLLNAVLSILIINIFSSISLGEFGISMNYFSININLLNIVWIFVLIIVHELLHLVIIPNFHKSNKTFIGFTPFGGYVHTEEELSKPRFILITITPFIVLSILLPLVLSVFGLLTTTIKALILLNSMSSSVDILAFVLIVFQVPRNATLRNNGTKTYFKIPSFFH